MNAKSYFGLYMRQMRRRADLTAAQLAHAIGCDLAVINAVEMNLKEIPGAVLLPWANALGLNAEEIILVYVNQKARKMCIDAGIQPLFKVVPASWEELEYGQQSV